MYYKTALEKTLNYIEENLFESFTLSDLTEVNGFSQHHFSKLFHLITGYTISYYIRYRRLSQAGKILVETDDRVIDIALRCQFSTQASFTKTFTQAFGLSPNRYRNKGLHIDLIKPLAIDKIIWFRYGKEIKPEIVHLDPFYVMGMVYTGKNEKGEIKNMWQRFLHTVDTTGHKTYGICEQIEGELDLDNLDEFSYLAGIEVASNDQEMTTWYVTHQKYAVFIHQGSTELLGDTYKAIYLNWLPESGYELAKAYDFEMYDHRFKGDRDESKMFVYIPIK